MKQFGRASRAEVHRKYGLLLKYYWHRNFGTALSWFVWDFAFYGNKLFQGAFIKVINPSASLLELLLWTTLNSAVALVGYYFAAFTIDRQWMGRKRMQAMGFLMTGLLFMFCAVFYNDLIQLFQFLCECGGSVVVLVVGRSSISCRSWAKNHPLPLSFHFSDYFSSFWGQFGPNATTWLLSAELVPTEVRSACHGFSAAVGKAGALVAGVVFALVSDRTKFTISALRGLVGVLITYTFIADVTGLDLRDGDKRWLAILDGKHASYTGEAVNPKYLSLVERLLGYGKRYNASPTEGISGDHHTHALTVGGMIVATNTEEGAGDDDIQAMRGRQLRPCRSRPSASSIRGRHRGGPKACLVCDAVFKLAVFKYTFSSKQKLFL